MITDKMALEYLDLKEYVSPKMIIKDLLELRKKVCDYFEISEDDIKNGFRNREYVDARTVFCFEAKKKYPDFSDAKIGKLIKKDHATVLRSRKESILIREVWEQYCEFKEFGL